MGEKAVSAPSDVAFPEEGVSFRSLLLFFSSIPTEEQNRFSTASHSRSAHRPLLNTLFHPSRTSERNRISQSVATHDCTRDTVLGGAVASGVPHPLMGERCSLGSVESPCATRRCRAPSGTASPDAVPQMRSYRSHSPRAGQRSLSRHSSGTLL